MTNESRVNASTFQPKTHQKLHGAEGSTTDLEITVIPWGSALRLFEGATKSTKLWQLQLQQSGPDALTRHILRDARRALLQHPNENVRHLEHLEKNCHIRLLSGAPPQVGATDADSVGLQAWLPVLYCTGEAPLPGLDFINFILRHRHNIGQLPNLPRCRVLTVQSTYPYGELPGGWVHRQAAPDTYNPFRGAPPCGKRHLMMQLEHSNSAEKYTLIFFGGVYPFRQQLNEIGLSGGYIQHEADREYVRTISVHDTDECKILIHVILQDALSGWPIFFVNATGNLHDALATWLQEQPTVHFGTCS